MVFFLQQVIVSAEREEDDNLLKSLIDLVECVPKFIKHQLDMFFSLSFKVNL